MKVISRTLVAVAALGAVEFMAVGTPVATMATAYAQALPSVWQNKVKKITVQINKARQSLAANADDIFSEPFKTKQFSDRTDNYRNALAKVPASSDPLMAAAKAELAALDKEFAAAKGGDGATAATPAPTAPAPTTAPSTGTASSGSTATPVPAAPASNVRPLVSGERVRVKKLTRDMTNNLEAIKTEGPSIYQDPLEYNAAIKRFGQFTDALKKYPQADDPDVKAAREAYLALRAKLETELARGKQQAEILGDLMGNLRAVDARGKEFPVPDPLTPPFKGKDVMTWLEAGRKARAAAERDYKYIGDISAIAHLPLQTKTGRMAEFSFRDLPRLSKNIKGRYDAVGEGYETTKENIAAALIQLDNQVQTPTARTAGDELSRHRNALDAMIPIAESAVILEQALERPTAAAEKAVADLRARREQYEATRETAIDAVRLPKAVTDNAEMMAIAKEVVTKPRYDFGEHGPIILTMKDMSEHERKESEIEIDDVDVYGGEIRMSGTKETTVWKWTEFQFATVLKVPRSDLWRITYIKPKLFTQGGSTTPLNEWISGGVVEGELIRAENIK